MKQLSILLLFVTIGLVSFGQVYQEMPQYGYRANRMAFDSTLQIPTFCGVPTLRSVVKANKNGAIAFDSCNNKLYQYNPKTLTWSEISGGTSTDTTSLSNRINLKIDSLKRSNDSVYAFINGTRVFQFKDSVGGGGGDFWKTSGTTDLTGNTLIQSDNLIQFNGINGEIPQFFVFSNDIRFITPDHNFSIIDLTTTTDTSTYKPLGIASDGKLAPLTSWVGGGIASSDTIYTQNPIMFINRNDSNIVFFNADTANAWRGGGGIDSLKRSSDSVFARKNGNFIFQFKDSVGGAGSDTAKVIIAQVHNATATTLLKGEVVYLFGSTGNIASVKRANNKSDATSSKTFGIVRRDIVSGGTGFVTTQGQIEKLNLGSYAEGDVLWLDSLDGQFTKVKPQAPYHGVFIGVVERANAGNGLAYIKVQNGYELGEIHDVKINDIVNNQILVYSDTQQVWKNRSIYSVVDTASTIATKSNVALKLNSSDTASLSNRINTKQTDLDILQALGFEIKAEPYGVSLANVTSQLLLTTARMYLYPFSWNKDDSIRGIAFFNRSATTLTQNNYNGVAIYSLSGGTLTRETFTANNGTFWDNTANTWKTQPITPFFLTRGTYYLGYQVSGSAGVPTIASGQIMQTGLTELPSAINPNGIEISTYTPNATTSPPTTIAMSGTTLSQQVPYFILY
jgi:hypothetical protein